MEITDEKLYELCKKYGEQARYWRQKFIGLLPEVNNRRLYERKGFSSIFEFAFKLCGLSGDQVRLTLNLRKRFEDKPALKSLLENGEASINKLARVVSIVTFENERELAEKVKILLVRALETLVRDEKYQQNFDATMPAFENQNGLFEPNNEAESLHVQTLGQHENMFGQTFPNEQHENLHMQTLQTQEGLPIQASKAGVRHDAAPGQSLNFELSDDVKKQLNELHSKGFDMNDLLREMLKKRQEEIEKEKQEIAEAIFPAKSEYIPVKIKKVIYKEHGKKCSIHNCSKLAVTIHHTQRLSLSHTHNPQYLAPLCEEHHEIAHSIDLKYQKKKTTVGCTHELRAEHYALCL